MNIIGDMDDCDTSERVGAFINAQTAYIDSITAYSEAEIATNYANAHLIMTQVGMKKGIKMWGDKGVQAIIKEMKQSTTET